ncbi:MAG: hypothetical protein LBD28_05040 [Tannerellaceae bacterium]|jgi:hypothetical protein|nr:hypothetical protein [Tannerellaceae bacterium]
MRIGLFTRLATIAVALTVLTSCATNFSQDAAGFEQIQKTLKSKFGDKAYYTDLSVIFNKATGAIINVTQTSKPESLKLEEWTCMKGAWSQRADVTLEISDGVPTDFMYQLSGKFELKNLGAMVEKSIKKLQEDKKIKNPQLEIAQMRTPDRGSVEDMRIIIILKPENGGTSFTYSYNLDGELLSEDY